MLDSASFTPPLTATPATITLGAAGRTISYTYDALARLATAVTTGSTQFAKWGISETYDRYGNRLNQTVTAGSAPANSLTFATTPPPPANPPGGAYTNRPDGYTFDPSGNMLNDGINTLTYDAENCLISNTNSSTGTTAYTCDAAGVRVKKALQSGANTVYVFAGDLDIAEYDNGAAPASPSASSSTPVPISWQPLAGARPPITIRTISPRACTPMGRWEARPMGKLPASKRLTPSESRGIPIRRPISSCSPVTSATQSRQ